jgi:phosphocarrier protein
MKTFTYRLEDENGLHARPAGVLATFAKRFGASVEIQLGEKRADAKRLLSLMTLGARHGDDLCFCISGEDEESAARALEVFCREEWAKQSGGKTR